MNTQLLIVGTSGSISTSVSSQGANSGGTFADDASVGTVTWLNPSRAISSNNSYATVALSTNTSHYLKVTNFSFSIPTSAIITGIKVEIERKGSLIKDNSIKLVQGGTITGNNNSTGAFWTGSDSTVSFGSSTDLWGLTWIPAQINASDFGTVLSATGTDVDPIFASVDHIKITVYYQASTSTYQTSGTIDLYDDIPLSLNYNIADIKEPDKRNSDYSKTLKAPGTNNNNILFSHVYEIGIDRLFNPNKKIEARILHGGVTVMKGYLRLVKIRKLKDRIEYDLEIKGRLDDLMTNVKDKKLTDLTWSDLDHAYTQTNIINSWSAAVGSNYIYGFIDYGYSVNKKDYDVKYFAPGTYVKEIWDRILAYAGFQYSSTFLTGDFFKRLFIPFTSDKMRLTDEQIDARRLRASRATTAQTINVPNFAQTFFDVIFNDDSTGTNKDLGNNYNTATGIWTAPSNGNYIFSATITTIKDTTATSKCSIYFHVKNITTGKILGVSHKASLTVPSQNNTFIFSINQFSFSTGDQVKIQMSGIKIVGTSIDVNIQIDSFFQAQVVPQLYVGDTIPFVNTLPQKIKMSEFLISIIKMFNLYIEYDKDTPNKMRIEPRNDFYNSTLQNWSAKLDPSREPEITPMGALDAKRYIFRYRKDNDWLNMLYQDTYGQGTDSTYGERLKDVDNDFLKNDNVMESIFSPTPLYSNTISNRVYPLIEKVDSKTNVVSQIQANVRILYYGGLKTSTPSWTLSDNWLFNGPAINKTIQTQYPYCGHLDDPDAPTIDLSFGVPKEVYYIPAWNATYTNNNLYNKYWRQFIEEITDYNSSIITAWFFLSPVDISTVDFRNIYYFSGQNFRLNKIYDYNPNSKSPTKCEFIKIKAGRSFVARTKIFLGGQNASFGLQTASS